MEQQAVEVWKNTTRGLRWYTRYDRLGHEQAHQVRGGGTFVLTPFERQINQEKAATPDLDLFRNGSFVLVKGTDETNRDEIESPDALTDAEVLGLVYDVMGKVKTIEAAVFPIKSAVTLGRIHEQLVLEGADGKAIDFVKEKRQEAEGGVQVRRGERKTRVAAERVPQVKERDDELRGESDSSPGREIVPERVR